VSFSLCSEARQSSAVRFGRVKSTQTKAWSFEDFTQHIQSGGPPKDGIPPIDRPKYISATEADKFLKPNEIVLGLDRHGVVKAYPQKILVWLRLLTMKSKAKKLPSLTAR
jgi:hypothetical protein